MRLPVHVTYRRRRRHVGAVVRRLVKIGLLTALLYLVVSTLLLSSVRSGSVSMAPAILAGDRLLVSPVTYGARLLTHRRMPVLRPPQRGEVVVVEAPYLPRRGAGQALLDAVLGFVTGHYAREVGRDEAPARFLIKRVIGVPGDTVRMRNYRAEVKPAGAANFVDELVLIGGIYAPEPGPETPYPDEIPFGGALEPVLLKEGEYFVLGDNRMQSSDSRSWGPVTGELITARVLFRYAPLGRLGRL